MAAPSTGDVPSGFEGAIRHGESVPAAAEFSRAIDTESCYIAVLLEPGEATIVTDNDPKSTVTQLLRDVQSGETDASESLLDLVYDELRGLASALFARERDGHTLQPTALVNEAWLRLADHLDHVEDRVHFFAIAAQAMRRVLVDHARRCRRKKRGDGYQRVTLDDRLGWVQSEGYELVELDDSLTRLATLNPRHARVVELRILGGLTIAEAASVLGVSTSTIECDWFTAKAWLRTELARAS